MDTLVQLPLSVQSQFLLLHASLQSRMAHLMRVMNRETLATHMRRTDAAVWQAAAAMLNLPQAVVSTVRRAWTRHAARWVGI